MIALGVLAGDEYLKDPQTRAQIGEGYEVHDFSAWRSWDRATLIEKCRSVEVILTGRASPTLPMELAEDLGRLRWLLHLHGTIRHLVDKKLIEKGLVVTNWGDSVAGVAEGAMALLLCQLKQLVTLNRFVHGEPDARAWQAFAPTLNKLDVGLYGYGPIGRHMARMLEPFGARIAIYDPYARDVPAHIRVCSSLRELFATCPVISIHCGLNDQTRNSVTADLLALLPQGGIVINTARGGIVDEEALAKELAANRLLAGIDVIQNEKDWRGSPLAPHPGAVLTGHKVGSGKGYPPDQNHKRQLPEHATRNLAAYRQKQPLQNVITADIYDLKT